MYSLSEPIFFATTIAVVRPQASFDRKELRPLRSLQKHAVEKVYGPSIPRPVKTDFPGQLQGIRGRRSELASAVSMGDKRAQSACYVCVMFDTFVGVFASCLLKAPCPSRSSLK
jgi:hypothetical protein